MTPAALGRCCKSTGHTLARECCIRSFTVFLGSLLWKLLVLYHKEEYDRWASACMVHVTRTLRVETITITILAKSNRPLVVASGL